LACSRECLPRKSFDVACWRHRRAWDTYRSRVGDLAGAEDDLKVIDDIADVDVVTEAPRLQMNDVIGGHR
jgi:hypothetical protein